MYKLFSIPVIVVLFLASTFSFALDSNNFVLQKTVIPNDGIFYEITIPENNPKLAQVSMTFTPKDSMLYMYWGASKLPKRWATFVHNVSLKNSQGEVIKIEELPDAKWKMHTSLESKLTLTYDIHLDHESYEWSGGIDGAAFQTDLGVFYTGRSMFLFNGETQNNIQIKFNLPNQWKITTPWTTLNTHTFRSHNITDVATAMIFAGMHKEVILKRETFELAFALGDNATIEDEEEFKNLAQGVLDYYINLMGGIPNPRPDNPLNKAVVVIASSDTADGEAVGNNICILIEKDGDHFSQVISRFIFAHEFFHLWNGKSFSPEEDDTEWFKEGFSNYYTIKALHHVGFLNDMTFLEILSNFFYQKYHNDPGVGALSMTDGSAKHDHWGLIYGGGMLISMAQDIQIRTNSNNEKSLDDLMRSLFKNYGGTDKSYTLNNLREQLSALNGTDQSDFFDDYIIGTKKIPIDSYFRMTGFNSKIEEGKLENSKNKNATPLQIEMMQGFFGKN